MNVKVKIIFTPDGKGRCLYSEIIDLSGIGPLSMRRATTIEFDNAIQHWVVRDPDGTELFSNPSRQVCLDWEREHLEQQESLKHGPKNDSETTDTNDKTTTTTTTQGEQHERTAEHRTVVP